MAYVWKALAVVLFLSSVTNAQTTANLLVTAFSNLALVYQDGNPITPLPNAGSPLDADVLPVNALTRLVAIRGINILGGCSGIMAEVQDHPDGLEFYTTVNWKCSAFPGANWQNLGYDDSTWEPAHTIATNGQLVPGCSIIPIPQISEFAYWIWTPNFLEDVDNTVSCRGYTTVCQELDPCRNGGSCLPNSAEFCACPVRFGGPFCETPINECDSQPCKNGGQCDLSDEQPGYVCDCGAFYSGPTCEIDLTACASAPCENGATCIHDGEGGFSCSCVPGYAGELCEDDIDECACDPCLNGGTCYDEINRYRCECALGFEGEACATNINDCLPEPCLNGATCVDGIASFVCECHPGWSGYLCEIGEGLCESSPCLNGGTCTLSEAGAVVCLCTEGWFGPTCDSNQDDCRFEPCENGGTCVDGNNDFTCTCHPFYEGKTCRDPVPHCGSLMAESSYGPARNFWAMCEIDILNHPTLLTTPCNQLIRDVNIYNNSANILAIGGNFGCFVTKYPDEMPAGACVDNYNQNVQLGACLSCTHLGVCIRVPGYPPPN